MEFTDTKKSNRSCQCHEWVILLNFLLILDMLFWSLIVFFFFFFNSVVNLVIIESFNHCMAWIEKILPSITSYEGVVMHSDYSNSRISPSFYKRNNGYTRAQIMYKYFQLFLITSLHFHIFISTKATTINFYRQKNHMIIMFPVQQIS